MEQIEKDTNALIHETSPYLLQHAHNPVNWLPWGEQAFKKAEEEDKLVLISIGYSSCHWCHVMERESFEDQDIAAIMNEHFICIKVDREEHPDVDQVYMDAVQLMTGSGGWPLNCFALPDGRPVYGGTYFPESKWAQVLLNLADVYKNNRDKILEYAEKLMKGIEQNNQLLKVEGEPEFQKSVLEEMLIRWKKRFDIHQGGPSRAPKFPLPNNYEFLLKYAHLLKDKYVEEHVQNTLQKMAYGGIYDQIGGGFTRYSTDMIWKVPHFEKMLYDNAQLVELYAQAYVRFKNPLYKSIVEQTLAFIEREMCHPGGGFYAALDADSEGEEGKFYTWTKAELKELLEEDYPLVEAYYNINENGKWEGKYIPLRRDPDKAVAATFSLSVEELNSKITEINQTLLEARSKRVRPGLDDKILTSWNAMMIAGYASAFQALGDNKYLEKAQEEMNFLLNELQKKDGSFWHTYQKGAPKIDAYLEDYAFVIDALLDLYQSDFNEKWLEEAIKITAYTIEHFYDDQSGFFYFTSKADSSLVANKLEVEDNVIPSTNSTMARNLYKLGLIMDKQEWSDMSVQMLHNVYDRIDSYGSAYSNWGILALHQVKPFYEIAITGENSRDMAKEMMAHHYIPNAVYMAANKESKIPLLEGKLDNEQATIYVCHNKTCQKPVHTINEAMEQIK